MTTPPDDGIRVSHVALAVADMEISTRFYAEGLGFEPSPDWESGDEVAEVSEVKPPVRLRSRYLTKGGFRLELLNWLSPPVEGVASEARNQRGLTHLAFRVDDIEGTEARLLELGGTPIPAAHSRVPGRTAQGGQFALAALCDPDGIRIELVQRLPE